MTQTTEPRGSGTTAVRSFPKLSAVGAGVVAALLAGCGALQQAQGDTSPIGAAGALPQIAEGMKTEKFGYTGAQQSFTVPAGVTHLTVGVSGASGASGRTTVGGDGGWVKATIPVTPGETLALFVGGEGGADGSGGFNGGASAGKGHITGSDGGGGGGASDVRQGGDGLTNRVVIAGGGGGAGGNAIYGAGSGGAGGGQIGGAGEGRGSRGGPDGHGGQGGTQSAGGRGGRGAHRSGFHRGRRGDSGTLGVGGSGGGAIKSGGGGGGGGGGYYGGGGGGAGSLSTSGVGGGGGGAGASSFIEETATHVQNRQGAAPSGDGQIVIHW